MKLLALFMLMASSFVALGQTVVDVAAMDPELSTFVEVVRELGFADVLSGPGPFTVFAPTNTAFNIFMNSGIEVEDRARLLMQHIIVGSSIRRNELRTGFEIMANGEQVTVAAKDNQGDFIDNAVTLGTGGARVRRPSYEASNGWVHSLTRVLVPPPLAPRFPGPQPPPQGDREGPSPPLGTKGAKSAKGTKSAKSAKSVKGTKGTKGTKSAKSAKSAKSKGTKNASTKQGKGARNRY